MSKSTITVKRLPPKVVTPPPSRFVITLNLSEEDAKALLALTDIVGGDMDNSFRSVTDEISDHLLNSGLKEVDASNYITETSNIYFRNRKYYESTKH